MSPHLPALERLGVFYLGKQYDLAKQQVGSEYLLYDAKDLTTHAVCVGMTGSGKTGLCLALLEEAAIDGIPAIAIDPKGDLGNLLLTFPELRASDFAPWVDADAAAREGLSREQYAEQVAQRWRAGLAAWEQSGERIAQLRAAVDLALYTPGSTAGRPLSILRSFDAPPEAVRNDPEALRDHLQNAVSGLLALVGMAADPLQSREHILIASLLERVWREGKGLDLAGLIRHVQSPPLERIGVFDLETFFPAAERLQLAMLLNNLLASPAMEAWREGEPLDVQRLLYTAEGKPRLSILSIAHLSEAERMFFVTRLLGEVVAWMRSQPGTASLRAVLYMDEVFGFFPPVANPPSKLPMLTLLKQARAYGLGVVLSTQNPVDLDYKGLANAGTWLLGRLQTDRDKQRVLDGLEGAAAQSGATFNRAQMDTTLSALGNRVFLMNNVHDDQPAVFQSRWALSYLRGPLTRDEIARLVPLAEHAPAAVKAEPAPERALEVGQWDEHPPVVAGDVPVRFVPAVAGAATDIVYRPTLLGHARLHFVHAASGLDLWREEMRLRSVALEPESDANWEAAEIIALEVDGLPESAQEGAVFARLPGPYQRAATYQAESKRLRDALYRTCRVRIWKCAALKEHSQPDETEAQFRARLRQSVRERRDRDVEALRQKYAPKLAALETRIRTAERRVAREQSQAEQARLHSYVSMGSSLLGALLGRKLLSHGNVGRAGSSVRSMGRAAQQQADVAQAAERVEDLVQQREKLEHEFQAETQRLEKGWSAESLELEAVEIRPRKTEISVEPLILLWVPWRRLPSGGLAPAAQVPSARSRAD